MAHSGQQIFKLHKMDDRTAYDLISKLRDVLSIVDPVRLRLLNGFDYNVSELGDDAIETGKYLYSIFMLSGTPRAVGTSARANIHIHRGKPSEPSVYDKDFDYVLLDFGNDANIWASHAAELMKCIDIVTSADVVSIPESSEASEILRSLIVSQNASHQRMLEELGKKLTDLSDRRAELEAEAVKRDEERQKSFEDAQKKLDDQREALERQSHMSTRRKTGQTIHKIMTEPSGNAVQDAKRRRSFAVFVFTAYLALGVAGAIGTWLTFQTYQSEQAPTITTPAPAALPIQDTSTEAIGTDFAPIATTTVLDEPMTSFKWFLIVKFVLSSAVTIFGFVSAANWMRRHLDNEIKLQEEKLAFIADVERASWVIEAIHEVKHEAKGDIPQEWVDAVTRNLFAPRVSSADLDDGAQAVRALLGLAAGAKIGPQGLEMEFNKKGTKALAESGE